MQLCRESAFYRGASLNVQYNGPRYHQPTHPNTNAITTPYAPAQITHPLAPKAPFPRLVTCPTAAATRATATQAANPCTARDARTGISTATAAAATIWRSRRGVGLPPPVTWSCCAAADSASAAFLARALDRELLCDGATVDKAGFGGADVTAGKVALAGRCW